MRIAIISDTHGQHANIKWRTKLDEIDLVIHAGDISNIGGEKDITNFICWFNNLPSKYKIFIAGNHDKSFDPKFSSFYDIEGVNKIRPHWLTKLLLSLPSNCYYLENEGIEIEGLKIWGSPQTPWFHGTNWAFNEHRGDDIRSYWAKIPQDTDIIITHGPVSYKLDYVPDADFFAGCNDLHYFVEMIKPILHTSGHIHEGYGICYNEHTTFINASICNLRYQPVNAPVIVDIDPVTKELKFC